MNNSLIKLIINSGRKKTGGFTLLELLVTFMLLAVIMALAIPSYLSQANKARTVEAKMVLGAMNRSQHFYRFEKGTFATTIDELKLAFSVGYYQDNAYHGSYYTYTIDNPGNIQEIHHRAVPLPTYAADTYQFISAVVWDNSVISISLCEADAPNTVPILHAYNDCENGSFLYLREYK